MKRVLLVLMVLAATLSAHSIALTLDAPDTGISGLTWGNNNLWVLSANSRFVHQVNPTNGAVISTFYFNYTESMNPTGLAYNEATNTLLCGGWLGSNGYVYQYNTDGSFVYKASMCGG